MALTFKQLQDKVLGWLDEQDDSTVVLANVQEALNAANAKRAGSREWPFMLSSAQGTLVPGVRVYNLALNTASLLSVYNSTRQTHYRQVPFRHWRQGDTVVDGFVFDGSRVIFLCTPETADTVVYYYYREPTEMTADDAVPDIPYPYSRVLIYDALLDLGLYSEDLTPDKMALWQRRQEELEADLLAANLDANSVGASPALILSYTDDE